MFIFGSKIRIHFQKKNLPLLYLLTNSYDFARRQLVQSTAFYDRV